MNIVVIVRSIASPSEIFKEGCDLINFDNNSEINPQDLYAVEAAINCKEEFNWKVIALSAGGVQSKSALQRALSMGCDDAFHIVCQDELIFNNLEYSKILQHAIKVIDSPKIIFGASTYIDTNDATILIQLAKLINYNFYSFTNKIVNLDQSTKEITISRRINGVDEIIKSKYPVILSIDPSYSEPRYPSFSSLMQAEKFPIHEYSLIDIGYSYYDNGINLIKLSENNHDAKKCQFITGNNLIEVAENLYTILASKGLV